MSVNLSQCRENASLNLSNISSRYWRNCTFFRFSFWDDLLRFLTILTAGSQYRSLWFLSILNWCESSFIFRSVRSIEFTIIPSTSTALTIGLPTYPCWIYHPLSSPCASSHPLFWCILPKCVKYLFTWSSVLAFSISHIFLPWSISWSLPLCLLQSHARPLIEAFTASHFPFSVCPSYSRSLIHLSIFATSPGDTSLSASRNVWR